MPKYILEVTGMHAPKGEPAGPVVFNHVTALEFAAAEPGIKLELIRAIGARNIASASDVLLSAAADTSRAVRLESVRALRETAVSPESPALSWRCW